MLFALVDIPWAVALLGKDTVDLRRTLHGGRLGEHQQYSNVLLEVSALGWAADTFSACVWLEKHLISGDYRKR